MKLGVYQPDGAGRAPEERLDALGRQLAGQHLDLVLCPELFLGGYNAQGAHERLAETPDGPFAQGVAALAREHGTAIAYGYPERGEDVIYNAAQIIGPDGASIANHRKRLPSPNSFEETTFANGDSFTFAEYCGLRIAIVICYEVEFPESVRKAALGGAHLVLVPTGLVEQWRIVAERLVPTRAFENGVWLAYANHAGREGEMTYLGGSRIVAPNGSEAALAATTETLIAAPIDRTSVAAAQARLPYLRDCALL